ncbi:MAG TPA: M13 family metallopeptidase, partial [Parvularculaceae bacterium]|nr:M13 family metallopeptidase [Parvularculaceae bacterium]
ADLERDYQGFPWRLYLQTAGAGEETEFVINESEAIKNLAALFAETPVEVWRDYLKLHYLINYASVLPASLDEATFELFGKTLHGQQQQRDRRKRAIAAINSSLGEAVGEIYVKRYFPPEARREMDRLVENVVAAFDERIRNLDWMGDETKAEALTKLSKFKPFVVGPKVWRDYADFTPTPDNALENMKRSNASTWRYYSDRLGKPVDPENQWGMTPQVVNAYYSPPNNAIFFPAAILQPPFFDPNADAAVNYGGIAAVIGHEIGHGFDDQGRKSDGDGLLRDWWADADAKNFAARADALGKQYATYVPVDDIPINPDLTMGENVGDLGGLSVAYQAYRNSLGGGEAPVIDGLTGDQRFFLAYGQIWRRKYTDADLRHRMYADPHSPSEFRVNGIVRNMDAWYEAFNVKPGDKLYLAPDERVRIW